MLAILVEEHDPKEFGFDRFDKQRIFSDLIAALKKLSEVPDIAYALYGEMISKLKKIYSYDECPNEIKIFYHASFIDIMLMLKSIKIQEETEKNNNINLHSYAKNGELFYKQYLRTDMKRYQELCEYAYQYSVLYPTQKVDYWIGNSGFTLDNNEHVEEKYPNIIIHSKRGNVVFEGWAADFVNGTPLAELFVIIDNNYYNLNYGLENIDLAKHFNNDLLSEIAFRAEIPLDVFKKIKNNEISFCLISYQGEKMIRYPEIKYIVSVE